MAIRLSGRERTIFFLCLAVVFVYFVYIFLYQPFQEQRSDLSTQIEAAQREFMKNSKFIENSQAYQAEYDTYLEKFKQQGSEEEVMSSFVSEIEQIAAQFNVRIAEMKPRKVRREDFYNNFSVNLNINTRLNDLIRFLYVLQSDPHFFGVEEFRFDKNFPQNVNLQCQLTVSKTLFPVK
ncbi:MAG: hypothetical protein A2787_02230 [Omnitrophica WOR_2 bacterium RIFCSPHIGHO2_01_FULL_48_9]|nr:MAG: hypothetical protein A3D10_09055 [Omnitrophica WOR_2 bacterium RIFCSPHIGHO2_02_FULL_48_11]OGX30087.1 MAG: hypothetical protein A2787_02230 [Omnitrophica WOR_2 bacterium RIFCSPHIGHO2_01_FULL_48_9]